MLGTIDEESVRLEISIEIAADAQRASQQFWKLWLWQSRETTLRPSSSFCSLLAERFGISTAEVSRQWSEWYDLLTSWELASALVGEDIRTSRALYGSCHRRV